MTAPKKIPKSIEDKAIQWLCTLNRSHLSQVEQDAFTQWLSSSAVNQAAYIKAEGLWERGEALQHLNIKESNSQNQWWRSRAQSPAWIAACSCLMLILFVFTYNYLPIPEENHSYKLLTQVGEQSKTKLNDGSYIEVNTNSRLSIELTSDSRTVQLVQGEAFFDVTGDPDRPFYVVTRNGKVRVVGTQFSVYQTQSDTIITVLEGKVSLSPSLPNSDTQAHETVLKKDERTSFTAVNQGALPEKIDAKTALSWRKRHLIFSNASLRKVASDLNRYFPESIVIDPSDVGFNDIKITGIIMIADMEGALSALSAFNVEAKRDSSGKIITLGLKETQ